MIIAQYGDFTLSTKTYPADANHEYFVRDVELGKVVDGEYLTIATFNKEGLLVSCQNRLMTNINTQEDILAVRSLTEIAALIYAGENVKSGYQAK